MLWRHTRRCCRLLALWPPRDRSANHVIDRAAELDGVGKRARAICRQVTRDACGARKEMFALESRLLRFAVERFRRHYKKCSPYGLARSPLTRRFSSQTSPMNLRPSKLVECPYEVRIDGVLRDQFYDVRDAMGFARIIKQKNPMSTVIIVDARTGKLALEVER